MIKLKAYGIKILIGLVITALLGTAGYFSYREWRSITEQNALLNKELVDLKENFNEFQQQVEANLVAREELDSAMAESRRRHQELVTRLSNTNLDRMLQTRAIATVAVFQQSTDEFYERVKEETK